ncbi:helix-turn-helix domain-containing protein [Georgenia sp. EYE_87]|uniref:helix-turn-helix domain-containing protein n=1 Tax=Georgenia sp. EYE_87 TaxID=2853448 RepID=UPI0020033367|nr:helix-turn-helix transcriptional regulator [Georgenia sp. EYE_87]MCK6210518.1 helix-turn-helix domain-containing protein [Georgenia sp. EYE_87]
MDREETLREQRALGEVIKQLRSMSPSRRQEALPQERMTRQEFAELVGVSPVMIAKIEQGAKPPPARRLTAIAAALGVDPFDLSDRGAMWARIRGTSLASQAALRRIATGRMPTPNPLRHVFDLAVGDGRDFVLIAEAKQLNIDRYLSTLREQIQQRVARADLGELEAIAASLGVPTVADHTRAEGIHPVDDMP